MPTGIYPRQDPKTIFLKKINKTATCWMWKGAVYAKTGYGHFNTNKKDFTTHRFSWLIHKGDIPEGLLVLHICDVRACCNPEHLYIGNHKDNVRDAVERKRLRPPKWEKHRDAKLNRISVIAIRDLYKSGQWSYARLGEKFGVSKSCIDGVVSGRHWKGL